MQSCSWISQVDLVISFKSCGSNSPTFQGRLFLQDLPKTIESVDNTKKAFETITHDFLIPQPIQGTYDLNPPFTLRLLPRSPN